MKVGDLIEVVAEEQRKFSQPDGRGYALGQILTWKNPSIGGLQNESVYMDIGSRGICVELDPRHPIDDFELHKVVFTNGVVAWISERWMKVVS